jgi:menaquinone-dependent protoporphyrinogen oxidase
LPANVDLDQYGAFLVAASVVAGRHQRYVEEFVRLTAPLLNRRPSAFVSVSGSAASPSSAKQEQAKQYVREFLRSTGWSPRVTATFGGAIAYTKYWFFLRWVMKGIAKRNGNPTDTSRDHELTDWKAVDRFAEHWAQTLSETGMAAGAMTGAMI